MDDDLLEFLKGTVVIVILISSIITAANVSIIEDKLGTSTDCISYNNETYCKE